MNPLSIILLTLLASEASQALTFKNFKHRPGYYRSHDLNSPKEPDLEFCVPSTMKFPNNSDCTHQILTDEVNRVAWTTTCKKTNQHLYSSIQRNGDVEINTMKDMKNKAINLKAEFKYLGPCK